jgi:hypothetical protein
MSLYLQTGDYAAYGAPNATTALVQQASSLIDAYLSRPEGLVWMPDGNGAPCYMQSLTPSLTFTCQGAISPGSNVQVTVSPALITPDSIGDVLVLDRANTGVTEACVITATNGNNQVTLGTVQFAHASGCLADQGVVLLEERYLPGKRSLTQLSRLPAINILSLMGRYAYGRRSDQVAGLYQEMNLLAAIQTFGGPPMWIPVPLNQVSLNPSQGTMWVPADILLAYYSEVRVRYIAGFSQANVPNPIKQATAQVIGTLVAMSSTPLAAEVFKAGTSGITRFIASNIDADTKRLIEPFKARKFF